MLPNQSTVNVPPELQRVAPAVLEEYARSRVSQGYHVLIGKLRKFGTQVPIDAIIATAQETLGGLPGYDSQTVTENRELQLVFRHDCLALGCLDPQCVLCQHNPQRRCNVNFDKKYLVSDQLKAKCGATIRVELIDRATGAVVEDDLPDVRLEMNVLDGNLYDNKFIEAPQRLESPGEQQALQLQQCSLLLNNRQQPLLACTNGGTNDQAGRVVMQLQRGKAQLPDLHVTDSSEALLSGRKPPFRLLVRAVSHASGLHLSIRHAVSEGFVVATRRTRTAGKVDIPSVDDHVSKLEHMGKETVRKLGDLSTAARQAGAEIEIPENCVQKVGEFKQLAMRAEQDGHLRQQLQHVLKLSKEKWDEARDHAMRAVVPDNRMRAWYADRRNMEVGLLFTCRLGSVDLERPVGLLQRKAEAGEAKMEVALQAAQTPVQRDAVRRLNPEAVHHWWMASHPGWAIFPTDTDHFEETGQLLLQNTPPAPSSPSQKPAPPIPLLMPPRPPVPPSASNSSPDGPPHQKPPPLHPHAPMAHASTPFAAASVSAVFPLPPALRQLQDAAVGGPSTSAGGQGSRHPPGGVPSSLLSGLGPPSPMKEQGGPHPPPSAGALSMAGLSGLSFPSGLLAGMGAGHHLLPGSLDLDASGMQESMAVASLLPNLFSGTSLRLNSIELQEAVTNLHHAPGPPPPGPPPDHGQGSQQQQQQHADSSSHDVKSGPVPMDVVADHGAGGMQQQREGLLEAAVQHAHQQAAQQRGAAA